MKKLIASLALALAMLISAALVLFAVIETIAGQRL